MSVETRETKELVLESGVVVTLYEYITGRDQRSIKEAYLKEASISSRRNTNEKNNVEVNVGGVSGAVNIIMEDLALKAVIKSVKPVGGEEITDKQAIVEFVLDLRGEEYDKIVTAVNEVTEPKKA